MGFAGEICDGLTGQYYLRARFYNPVIGRFLNEDTYYGDGLNLYSYCRNNPVRYVDPSGHWCEEKQARIDKYKERGYSEADAEKMANYEKLRETEGVDAAEKYLREQKAPGGRKGKTGRMDLAGKKHPVSGVEFNSEGFPIFESKYNMQLDPQDYKKSRSTHFDRASKALYDEIMKNNELKNQFTDAEIAIFKEGGVPKSYTWHHHQDTGKMQLVNRKIHRQTGHTGGFSIWGPGN